MEPESEAGEIVLEVIERCPECGHTWTDEGPAHFVDCRYFCLDDERDEDSWPGGCGEENG